MLKSVKRAAVPVILSIACVFFSYSLNSGITITNDGSHFALFDSLVTTGSPELKTVKQFAHGDSALYDGRYYSDRNPGLALFTVAFYQGARYIEPWTEPLRLDPQFNRSYNGGQRSKIGIVMLVPAFAGGLVFLLTFLLARQMGVGYLTAIASSAAVLFGTILIRYTTVFYSHALATAFLVSGLFCVFSFRNSGAQARVIGGVFLLSCAVLVEHLTVLVFLPVLAYLLYTMPREILRPTSIAGVVLAGLVPMSLLMTYNYICFDSPLSIAHFHHSHDKANHEISTLLRFDKASSAAINLLFGAPKSEVGRQDLTGLFSSSPFLYFAFFYPCLLVAGYRKPSAEHLTLFCCMVLLIVGGASVWDPYGGWDRDYRYFVVIAPLFTPFLGTVLDFLFERHSRHSVNFVKYAAILMFVGLFYVSVTHQLAHVRHAVQIQAPSILINTGPALVNVTLFLGLLFTLIALVTLVTRVGVRIFRTDN
jgi:hypothetical protein